MIGLRIRDVELENEDKGFVYCEDECGNMYRFPVTYKKARIIALLLADAYVRQGNMYEFIVDLLNSSNLYIESLIIEDGKDAKAFANIADSNGNRKQFYISIPDALVLSLLANRDLYIDNKADFIFVDELEDIAWYRFLKELDLCR